MARPQDHGRRGDRRAARRVYDAFAHSRADRGGLQLLGPGDARAFRTSVRERSLDNLDRLEQAADERLALDAYAVGLVMQHELQHAETMCQTLQAAPGSSTR